MQIQLQTAIPRAAENNSGVSLAKHIETLYESGQQSFMKVGKMGTSTKALEALVEGLLFNAVARAVNDPITLSELRALYPEQKFKDAKGAREYYKAATGKGYKSANHISQFDAADKLLSEKSSLWFPVLKDFAKKARKLSEYDGVIVDDGERSDSRDAAEMAINYWLNHRQNTASTRFTSYAVPSVLDSVIETASVANKKNKS